MALTKEVVTIADNLTVSAGAAAAAVGSELDLSSAYGATLDVRITNGTAPTVAAQVQIQTTPDGTSWYDFGGPIIGSLTLNAAVSRGGIELPVGIKKARLWVTGATGQAVTLRAQASKVTRLV
ncbi:MAG: hypothetical protein SF069_02935 [Phycisphaerae bacterium]|nr:hypothetical protein [Phycisphaerae bacterium]